MDLITINKNILSCDATTYPYLYIITSVSSALAILRTITHLDSL